MPKFMQDLFAVIMALGLFIIEVEFGGGPGPEKKAKVINKIKQVINQPGGLDFPTFLPANVVDFLLDKAVDILVAALNKYNFFGKSKT